MSKYSFYGTMWSRTGCPGEFLDPGWYTKVGDKFIVKEYRNPATGQVYTEKELDAIQGIVVPPYIKPVKPMNSASMWVIGIILLIVVAGVIWFVVK